MSIERCLRALACFCTSALLATQAFAEIPAYRAQAAALEAELASKREVYLVLAVDPAELSIRVRGVALERLEVEGVKAFESRRSTDAGGETTLELPRAFATAATISLVDRRVVAPKSLEQWSEEAETGRAVTGSDARPVAPSSYDVPLDGGWVLEIRQEPVDLSARARLLAALHDGWRRVSSRDQAHDRRPSIRLVLDAESASRIHHLFQKGTMILVVPDMSYRPRR